MSSGIFRLIWGKTSDRRSTLSIVHVAEVLMCDVEIIAVLSHFMIIYFSVPNQ